MPAEQRFRSRYWWLFVFVVSPVCILLVFWIAIRSGFGLARGSMQSDVLMLLVLGSPLFAPKTLALDDQGVRIEPLLGRRLFGSHVAWADIHRVELYSNGVTVTLHVLRRDGTTENILLNDFGSAAKIQTAISAYVEIVPAPIHGAALVADFDKWPFPATTALVFACLVLASLIERSYLTARHSGTEPLAALVLITSLLSIVAAGLRIQCGRKPYPWFAAVLSGGLLGVLLASALQSGNRLLTEAGWRTEEHAEFRLEFIDKYRQRWAPVDPQAWGFDKGYFEVSKGWPGYDATLQPGATYRLTVWRGALNDIAFPLDAFHTAERVE